MKITQRPFNLFLLFLIPIVVSSVPALAQHSEYQKLAFRNDRAQIHVNTFLLPGKDDNHLKLTTTFYLSNGFLSFKKLHQPQSKDSFFSTAGLNLEVFEAPQEIKNMPKNGRRRFKKVDVKGLKSVGRAAWRDTAFAATYEQTKSDTIGIDGSLQVDVAPGMYTYLLQLNQDDKTNIPGPRRENERSHDSQTRNTYVPSYNNQRRDNIILVKAVDDLKDPARLQLINRGDNVTYGQDFYALIHIPEFDAGKTYSVKINRINLSRRDTTNISQVFSQSLSPANMLHHVHPQLQSNHQNVALALDKQQNGYDYALIKIPNAQFPNAVYHLYVSADDARRPVAQGIFRSYWSDIPTSLLSLDVAIDMLHYIADNNVIDKIDDGSDQQRERKFRAFWKAKDPTPDTEFNELEAEYYRRIDYAYENFGSQGVAGYNADRGKVYINFGPPQNTKRTFPDTGATTEVWTYPNRTFVFKATSGFGNFKLVSQK